ncbi:hypothetical protein [Acinetobacter calcoaceticus]|uniref:hypothetical protein n=1 Tax=Acinetobacter calcoaceticus TaxID=471 RepID=UPI00124DD153|nr:hypothetical protein [Acinetobacter calcoaceticus]
MNTVNLNLIFGHLLKLTQLDEDMDTLIKLYEEQGLYIDESRIIAWSKNPLDPNSRNMPVVMFNGFMNILTAVKVEAAKQSINMFDLREILSDLRDSNGICESMATN